MRGAGRGRETQERRESGALPSGRYPQLGRQATGKYRMSGSGSKPLGGGDAAAEAYVGSSPAEGTAGAWNGEGLDQFQDLEEASVPEGGEQGGGDLVDPGKELGFVLKGEL